MGSFSRKEDKCPQLLDLIPKRGEWHAKKEGRSNGLSDERKLELRLGPPGEDWTIKDGHGNNKSREKEESFFSLVYYPNTVHSTTNTCGVKRGAIDAVEPRSAEDGWINSCGNHTRKFSSSENPADGSGMALPSPWPSKSPFFQLQSQGLSTAMKKESSQNPCTKLSDLQNGEKGFSPVSANTAVPNSSQKRCAPSAVVGWPPIRSSRKNLASGSSSKSLSEAPKVVASKVVIEKPTETGRKDRFVKINMDGVPIGRKVDLQAYDSYENLSSAVDELFRVLLAAQADPSVNGIQNKEDGEKVITGLLDGSGEYTLVYEDNEGDTMLVGDVPWHMFVHTVKRLRVLKSSELPKLCLVASKQERAPIVDAGNMK